VPSGDSSHGPPCRAALFHERARAHNKYKNIMNTNILNTIAAPSVTIAVRKSAKGVVRYLVTIATRTSAQVYPCNSMATALKLAERVVTALTTPAAGQ